MRTALIIAGAMILLFAGVFWRLQRTARQPLIINPIGEPKVYVLNGATMVRFTVAVTNTTRSTMLATAAVVPARDLLDAHLNPFRNCYPWELLAVRGSNGPAFIEPTKLGPKAGALCSVEYIEDGSLQFILGADYHVMSPLDVKVRQFLHRYGAHWIRTNEIWHTVQIGRIMRQ